MGLATVRFFCDWWRNGVRGQGGGGGRTKEHEQKATVMRLMFLSNSARPSKITLDMSACLPDNKIKSIIILEVFYEF
jgi:hypothetical protein